MKKIMKAYVVICLVLGAGGYLFLANYIWLLLNILPYNFITKIFLFFNFGGIFPILAILFLLLAYRLLWGDVYQ